MPAQNALPAPVRIRICSVDFSTSSRARSNSFSNWKLSALRFSGRFNVIFAIPESYPSSRLSKFMMEMNRRLYGGHARLKFLGVPICQVRKVDGLHQPSPHHIQSLLRCEPAYASAVSREISFHYFSATLTCERVKDEAHRLFCGPTSRSCNTGHAQSQSCSAFFANTFC